jgi:hypothetical protein
MPSSDDDYWKGGPTEPDGKTPAEVAFDVLKHSDATGCPLLVLVVAGDEHDIHGTVCIAGPGDPARLLSEDGTEMTIKAQRELAIGWGLELLEAVFAERGGHDG